LKAKVAEAEAPAKVILLGEHFCVHGAPAVSMAVNLYARVKVKAGRPEPLEKPHIEASFKIHGVEDFLGLSEAIRLAAEAVLKKIEKKLPKGFPSLEIKVSSEIPVGAGLGSSASIASATIAAVSKVAGLTLSKDQVLSLCSIPEKFIHGSPSGIDQATVILGGLILFRRGEPPRRLTPAKPPSLIVGDTGVRRATKTLVEKFGRLLRQKHRKYLQEAENLTFEAVRALREGSFERLGEAMNKSHRLLSRLDVSTPELDRLVEAALNGGALGAKLTGAGGGGCMIALAKPGEALKIAEAVRKAGGNPYLVEMDGEGLRLL
jgi:mevalonate kinase